MAIALELDGYRLFGVHVSLMGIDLELDGYRPSLKGKETGMTRTGCPEMCMTFMTKDMSQVIDISLS